MLKCERVGPNRLLIDCGDVPTAELFEALCAVWLSREATTTRDLGDLTVYNAARDRLKQEHDYWQEQMNAVDTATDPDARRKVDAAQAQRDVFAAFLRSTMIDTNPA